MCHVCGFFGNFPAGFSADNERLTGASLGLVPLDPQRNAVEGLVAGFWQRVLIRYISLH